VLRSQVWVWPYSCEKRYDYAEQVVSPSNFSTPAMLFQNDHDRSAPRCAGLLGYGRFSVISREAPPKGDAIMIPTTTLF
jgi:hypothetical protein